jgi:phosphatidylglycerophosphate synthase
MGKPPPLQRLNEGLLSSLERPALAYLAKTMPQWVTPDLLTGVGFIGSIIMFAGYAWAAWTPAGLWIATIGFAINWFGDSLDGTLARLRKIERPKFGYFLDNTIDMVSYFLLAVGVGISGIIRWDLSFLALSVFSMLSILTFVRANVSNVFQITYSGIGPTEMRMAFILLNVLVFFIPPHRLDWVGLPMTYPNILSLLWSCSALVSFTISWILQLRELSAEDSRTS